MKKAEQTVSKKGQFIDSYCSNLKECIERNEFLKKFREQLVKKKHDNLFKVKQDAS